MFWAGNDGSAVDSVCLFVRPGGRLGSDLRVWVRVNYGWEVVFYRVKGGRTFWRFWFWMFTFI